MTDVDVIPLPKLPSTFVKDNRPQLASDYPSANRFSRLLSSIEDSASGENQMSRLGLSTLERYRRERRLESVIDKGEEKASRDRMQREKVEKQVRKFTKWYEGDPKKRKPFADEEEVK